MLNQTNQIKQNSHFGNFKNAALSFGLLSLVWTLPVIAQTVPQLEVQNASLAQVNYQGRDAVRLIATPDAANGTSYAVLKGTSFRDGVIEVDLAGKPSASAGPNARGFVGIAFRMRDGKYEYIYMRPTNGRAEDQVRRNHSTQYSSHPDFDFARLRQESPEKYESYVDLEPGAWTKYKIEIEGRKARLYVNGAGQPCLIVNDLKMEPAEGHIALWIGPGTEGYFTDLRIISKKSDMPATTGAKIYFDQAHGELPPPPPMTEISARLGFILQPAAGPITAKSLEGSRLVYLRAPNGVFTAAEKVAIVSFVKTGGSLLLVLDEEKRQSLSKTGVNDLIEPFGLKLTPDTPRVPNCGALAKASEINRADREIPYDGGRELIGGTPFAYQLDKNGQPAQPSAAWKKLDNGARIIVMGEGMASLFLGSKDGVRLKEDIENPQNTVYWGKDSQIYMEEVLSWLIQIQ